MPPDRIASHASSMPGHAAAADVVDLRVAVEDLEQLVVADLLQLVRA